MKGMIKEIIGKIFLSVFGLKKSLKIYYKIKTGSELNIDEPKKFSEKIQYRKLNDKNPLFPLCADKYKVRDYVKEKIGEKYLIPLYLCKDNLLKSDLDSLPESFVLKTNNGSKTNIIVKEKSKIDLNNVVNKMNKYLTYSFGNRTFELFYNDIKPLVIAEKYIGTENSVPNDYKIHVFNTGKIIIQVDADRDTDHTRNFYDTSWNKLDFTYGIKPTEKVIEKPNNLNEMIEVAKKLGEDFDYVRVDLYEVDNKVYFGELTFTHGSGFEKFNPISIDEEWGSYWKIK